jgi:hypothetical protein
VSLTITKKTDVWLGYVFLQVARRLTKLQDSIQKSSRSSRSSSAPIVVLVSFCCLFALTIVIPIFDFLHDHTTKLLLYIYIYTYIYF